MKYFRLNMSEHFRYCFKHRNESAIFVDGLERFQKNVRDLYLVAKILKGGGKKYLPLAKKTLENSISIWNDKHIKHAHLIQTYFIWDKFCFVEKEFYKKRRLGTYVSYRCTHFFLSLQNKKKLRLRFCNSICIYFFPTSKFSLRNIIFVIS